MQIQFFSVKHVFDIVYIIVEFEKRSIINIFAISFPTDKRSLRFLFSILLSVETSNNVSSD